MAMWKNLKECCGRKALLIVVLKIPTLLHAAYSPTVLLHCPWQAVC